MTRSGWRRWRDALAMSALAAFLGVAFTSALAGDRDPNYSLQPDPVETTELARGVDCETVGWMSEVIDHLGSSPADRQLRRDIRLAHRLLDCDD